MGPSAEPAREEPTTLEQATEFDVALWTRGIVREVIRKKFGVEYTPQGVGSG